MDDEDASACDEPLLAVLAAASLRGQSPSGPNAGARWRDDAARRRQLGTPVIDTPTLMLWGEQVVALTRATATGTARTSPS